MELPVERWVMAEDAHLVERDAAVGREVARDPRPLRDRAMHRDYLGDLRSKPPHRLRKRVAQPFHHLEQRQIGISPAAAVEPGAAAPVDDALEITEVFLRTRLPELARVTLRFVALVFVVERRR